MSIVAALLVLLLQATPRTALRRDPRDQRRGDPEGAGGPRHGRRRPGRPRRDGRAPPRPRAAQRLIVVTQRARENYDGRDTSFGFNINEATVKQRQLEMAAARVKETAQRALEGEKVYQSILDIFGFLKPRRSPCSRPRRSGRRSGR
jgi:hypothetical protein